jgi:hypothetical protein
MVQISISSLAIVAAFVLNAFPAVAAPTSDSVKSTLEVRENTPV